MKRLIVPALLFSSWLSGCSTEAARLDDDCSYSCRYPDSFYRPVETESPRDQHNRETANKHRKNVIEEREKNNFSVGYQSSEHVEIRNPTPSEPSVPDYPPSPKEKNCLLLNLKYRQTSKLLLRKIIHSKPDFYSSGNPQEINGYPEDNFVDKGWSYAPVTNNFLIAFSEPLDRVIQLVTPCY